MSIAKMRGVAVCATLLGLVFVWAARCEGQSGSPVAVKKVEIASGIYEFQSAADGYVPNDNALVVVNQDDVLVFDTFSRVSIARMLLAEIRKITDKPVRYVVNSHHHPDHWSGNEVFADAFPGVEIIATEEAREFMLNIEHSWPPVWTRQLKEQQSALEEETRSGKLADGSVLTAEKRQQDEHEVRLLGDWVGELLKVKRTHPTLTYRDRLTLRHGGREFRFLSVTGDASGTTVMYLPKEKILAVGDTIHFPVPDINFNLPVSRLNTSLKRLNELDVEKIIPGHGAVLDKGVLQAEIELQDSVIRQVGEIVKRGTVTVEEMNKLVDVAAMRDKFTRGDASLNGPFQHAVERMVENASKEARDGRKWEQ